MRRLLVGAIAVGALCTASAGRARAQAFNPLKFGFGGGPSFAVGDLGDLAATGFNVRGIVGLGAPGLPVGLRAELTYDWFPLKRDVMERACSGFSAQCTISGNVGVLSGALNGVYAFPVTTRARPYVVGGVGVYHQRLSSDITVADNGEARPVATGPGDDSQTRAGLNIGAGFRYDIRRWNIFAEARFVNVFTKDTGGTGGASRFIPVTVGVIF
jgi:opacity protein-like surface antigen